MENIVYSFVDCETLDHESASLSIEKHDNLDNVGEHLLLTLSLFPNLIWYNILIYPDFNLLLIIDFN